MILVQHRERIALHQEQDVAAAVDFLSQDVGEGQVVTHVIHQGPPHLRAEVVRINGDTALFGVERRLHFRHVAEVALDPAGTVQHGRVLGALGRARGDVVLFRDGVQEATHGARDLPQRQVRANELHLCLDLRHEPLTRHALQRPVLPDVEPLDVTHQDVRLEAQAHLAAELGEGVEPGGEHLVAHTAGTVFQTAEGVPLRIVRPGRTHGGDHLDGLSGQRAPEHPQDLLHLLAFVDLEVDRQEAAQLLDQAEHALLRHRDVRGEDLDGADHRLHHPLGQTQVGEPAAPGAHLLLGQAQGRLGTPLQPQLHGVVAERADPLLIEGEVLRTGGHEAPRRLAAQAVDVELFQHPGPGPHQLRRLGLAARVNGDQELASLGPVRPRDAVAGQAGAPLDVRTGHEDLGGPLLLLLELGEHRGVGPAVVVVPRLVPRKHHHGLTHPFQGGLDLREAGISGVQNERIHLGLVLLSWKNGLRTWNEL